MRTVLSILSPLIRFRRPGRRGQTLVEYSLILAVLTIVMIAAFSFLDQRIVVIFSDIINLLDTAQGSH